MDYQKAFAERGLVLLEDVVNATKQAKDFALEQLPDIAQQFVLYNRVIYTTQLVLLCLVAVGLLYLNWRIYATYVAKPYNKDGECDYDGWGGLMISITLSLFFLVPVAISFIEVLPIFIMSWVAPKILILQELSKLFK